jgi:quercetin dioxygenase-like cupin family protein
MSKERIPSSDAPSEKRDKLFWITGDFWRIVASGEDTGNTYSMMDVTILPNSGAKPHIHSREDEVFYVIDGKFELHYGDQKINAANGFHLFMKRGIPHSFRNVGTNEGRLLILFMPAGCEKLYEELGIPVTDIKAFARPYTFPNFIKIFQLLRKYGIEPKTPF